MNGTYPEVVDALEMPGPDLFADGEIVAFQRGQTSFERLQSRSGIHDPERARATGVAVYYYVFDLLDLDGRDLRDEPLLRPQARAAQGAEVHRPDPLHAAPQRRRRGASSLHACRQGWEGLIAKRADSPYRATRSKDWLKLKCAHAQELVIGGWTDPKGSRQRFGALLVGYWDGDRLRYAGKVGTGFDEATLDRLGDLMDSRERRDPPFDGGKLPRAHWVEPELVAQIAFTEWTRDGRLRHPRYQGLREDKPAREVVRERPSSELSSS